MSNLISDNSEAQQPWSPTEIVEQESDRESGLAQLWYGLTAPPRPPVNASFVRREADRKARLLSSVAFFFLLTLLLFFPACFFMPTITPIADAFAMLGAVIALLFNRVGRTTTGGIIMVLGAEIALASVILGIRPLSPAGIQLYDLYVIIILLAVSLLPPRSVFVFAVIHSIFTAVDLSLGIHPQTAALAQDLQIQTQLLPALVRPIGLQLIVSGVAYIWVRSATRAIERANRAEMVAMLEHTISEQRAFIEHEKEELEESIQQLIQAHVDATKGQLVSRISYPSAKPLWPLVGAMNALWARLQHTQQIEHELHLLRQAISYYTQLIQKNAPGSGPAALPLVRTGTDLDQFIVALRKLYSTSPDQNSSHSGSFKRPDQRHF
ncbi:MAG TPA: hypothetical protein VKR06_06895 [Ktedonosporobacter sp.]|nr:hypothetical protein [Ktedonosporobacter sp.]